MEPSDRRSPSRSDWLVALLLAPAVAVPAAFVLTIGVPSGYLLGMVAAPVLTVAVLVRRRVRLIGLVLAAVASAGVAIGLVALCLVLLLIAGDLAVNGV